jgi:hypothetical protein
MSKIAVLASLALVAPTGGAIIPSSPWRSRTLEVVVETFPSTNAEPTRPNHVLWRPGPEDESTFGFIPTDAGAKTELIPTTWNAHTVIAKHGSPAQK